MAHDSLGQVFFKKRWQFSLGPAKAISEWVLSPPQEVNDPRVKVKKCSVGPGDFGKLMKIAATLDN